MHTKKESDKEFGESFVEQTISDDESILIDDEQLKVMPQQRINAKTKLKLRRLNGAWDYPEKVLCIDENGLGYLVAESVAPQSNKDVREFDHDDKAIESLYNWDSEIEAMLPKRPAMVSAVRLSLYRAGALKSGDLQRNDVKRAALKTAFPYVISESLEE